MSSRPVAGLVLFSCILLMLSFSSVAAFGAPPAGEPRPEDLKPTFFSLPDHSQPEDIVAGSDGAMWFTEHGADAIGRITLSGDISTFPLSKGFAPTVLVLGADGALWFAGKDRIGSMSLTGALTEYPLPKNTLPEGITRGPDGAIWFTQAYGDKIGRIGAGVLTEFPIPRKSAAIGIVTGPDGALWFAESGGHSIGRMTVSGELKTFSLAAYHAPLYITLGPDDAVWFTDFTDQVERIALDGTIRETPLNPTIYNSFYRFSSQKNALTPIWLGDKSNPDRIITGPDGAIWFTERGYSRIGRISLAHRLTEVQLPNRTSPSGIAVGPDHALWFTTYDGSTIGRIAIPTATQS
jgi:virginiamycin B lyase